MDGDLTVLKEKNGVFLEPLQKFVETVSGNHALADVKFVAKSQWNGGTQTLVTINECFAGGHNVSPPDRQFKILVDEPKSLGGRDEAANPLELLAAALCGCITAGIATNAALFDTEITGIDVVVEANMNVLGFLGIDGDVPSQCNGINFSVKLSGPDGEPKLIKSAQVASDKSPVKNTLANLININSDIKAE